MRDNTKTMQENTSVTISVDATHGFKIGDTFEFRDPQKQLRWPKGLYHIITHIDETSITTRRATWYEVIRVLVKRKLRLLWNRAIR